MNEITDHWPRYRLLVRTMCVFLSMIGATMLIIGGAFLIPNGGEVWYTWHIYYVIISLGLAFVPLGYARAIRTANKDFKKFVDVIINKLSKDSLEDLRVVLRNHMEEDDKDE